MEGNKLVIVHGVQKGDDLSAVKGPQQTADALREYIAGRADFEAAFPAYEHLNEEAQSSLRTINKLVLSRLSAPVAKIFDALIDIVGDVFVYKNGRRAKEIRALVRKEIDDKPNCVLIGHSLGSVVCFDILMEMMNEDAFKDEDKNEWPIRSLITFGSPLALKMFKNQRELIPHGSQTSFHWYNYSDRNDPVVSGNIFGNIFQQNNLMRDTYLDPNGKMRIHDRQVETGFHLLSHINYWRQQHIIMRIADQFK